MPHTVTYRRQQLESTEGQTAKSCRNVPLWIITSVIGAIAAAALIIALLVSANILWISSPEIPAPVIEFETGIQFNASAGFVTVTTIDGLIAPAFAANRTVLLNQNLSLVDFTVPVQIPALSNSPFLQTSATGVLVNGGPLTPACIVTTNPTTQQLETVITTASLLLLNPNQTVSLPASYINGDTTIDGALTATFISRLTNPLSVSNGGTGQNSPLTANAIQYASSTTSQASLTTGTAGQMLQSGGSSGAPSWTSTPTLTSLTLSTPLSVTNGGTGQTSPFTQNALQYASSTTSQASLVTGTAGQILQSGGSSGAPLWTSTPTLTNLTLASPLSVTNGGTGQSSPFTANAIQYASSTTSQASLTTGTAGQILQSGGSSSAPLWTSTLTLTNLTLSTPLAVSSGGTGQNAPFTPNALQYASSTSSQASLATGTAGQMLQSNGAGLAPSWVATLLNPVWVIITTGTVVAAQNNTYYVAQYASGITNITLPTNPTIGYQFTVFSMSSFGIRILQNLKDIIAMGSQPATPGPPHYLTTTQPYSSISLTCVSTTILNAFNWSVPAPITTGYAAPSNVAVAYSNTSNVVVAVWYNTTNGFPMYSEYVVTSGLWSIPEPITLTSTTGSDVNIAYSSVSNSFMAVWSDTSNNNYPTYAFYFPQGGIWDVQATITTNSVANAIPISVAFSNVSNLFMATWADTSQSPLKPAYAVYNASTSSWGTFGYISGWTVKPSVAVAYNSYIDTFVATWQTIYAGDPVHLAVFRNGTWSTFQTLPNPYTGNADMTFAACSTTSAICAIAYQPFQVSYFYVYVWNVSSGAVVGQQTWGSPYTFSNSPVSLVYHPPTNGFIIAYAPKNALAFTYVFFGITSNSVSFETVLSSDHVTNGIAMTYIPYINSVLATYSDQTNSLRPYYSIFGPSTGNTWMPIFSQGTFSLV